MPEGMDYYHQGVRVLRLRKTPNGPTANGIMIPPNHGETITIHLGASAENEP